MVGFNNNSSSGTGIPYQPSHTIQPKYGFRYSSQPFVDTVSAAGVPNPEIPENPWGINKRKVSTTVMDDPLEDINQFNQDDDNDNVTPNYTAMSTARGYKPGSTNPISLVPYVGTLLAGATKSDKYNFGEPGTTDAYGNVFNEEGRSFNPITGAAEGYKSPSDWGKSWLGIGSEEGLGGSSSSYGKLRAAGESPISAGLGSWENSMHNISREQRAYGANPAGRYGIETTGGNIRHNTAISNPSKIFTEEIYGGPGGYEVVDYRDPFSGQLKSEFDKGTPVYDEFGQYIVDYEKPSHRDITIEELGIDPRAQGGSGISAFQQNKEAGMPTVYGDRDKLGKFTAVRTGLESNDWQPDIGEGSVVETNFGPGVVNSSGQVETAQGTVIQMSGVNDGNVIQKPPEQNDEPSSGGK